MTPLSHIATVGETWQRYTAALHACRDGMTAEQLRELVDSRNRHIETVEAATLVALKAAHGPVLERSLARAERSRR